MWREIKHRYSEQTSFDVYVITKYDSGTMSFPSIHSTINSVILCYTES